MDKTFVCTKDTDPSATGRTRKTKRGKRDREKRCTYLKQAKAAKRDVYAAVADLIERSWSLHGSQQSIRSDRYSLLTCQEIVHVLKAQGFRNKVQSKERYKEKKPSKHCVILYPKRFSKNTKINKKNRYDYLVPACCSKRHQKGVPTNNKIARSTTFHTAFLLI